MVGPDAFPGIGAGLEQAFVAEQLVSLGEPCEAAVHLVYLAIAYQGNIVILARQGDELQARSVVEFEDATVYQFLDFLDGPLRVEVAERIEHSAAGHAAVHACLGDLDALLEYRPVDKAGDLLRTVEIALIAGGDASLGKTLDEVGHDPCVPVYGHRLGGGTVVIALVFAVAAEIPVFFLAGNQIVGD